MPKISVFTETFFILIILLCIVSHANAQDEDPYSNFFIEKLPAFYGGVVIGTNFAQVDGDYFAGYYKVGLNVGGIGYIKFSKSISVSYEILYSQKGSKSNKTVPLPYPNDSIFITKYGINAGYAEIPVMINILDKLQSHLGVGISYNRLVSVTETMTTNKSPIDLTKYPFKKDDFELIAGAQLHLWKGLYFNLRFQYSLTPMRSDVPPIYARSQQYNNLWLVRMMYLIK